MSDTRIWTAKGFVENDPWQIVETQEELPAEGDVILPLEGFVALSEEVRGGISRDGGGKRNTRRVGVLIAPDDDPSEIADLFDHIALVALNFPKFSDGRGYSHAARLRQHLGYRGEIRAIGDVLYDQIPLMLRAGIDSFAVTKQVVVDRLAAGRLNGISRHYQPSSLQAPTGGGYSWRRLSA